MLTEEFKAIYDIFKMNFYASLCSNSKELNMQEAFSLDIIHMLGEPTILEYANYMEISQPNATYKINQMIEKGYLIKEPCQEDKRASRLKVTQKFLDIYRENDRFIAKTLGDIQNILTEEENELLIKMLKNIQQQMTKEIKKD